MILKETLKHVGKYNEDFKFTQNYDLWLRISKRYRAINLQEILYSVRRHENRVTLTRLYVQLHREDNLYDLQASD